MKLKNIHNIEELFKVIDECEGKVEIIGEDIRLNLKSKLSQYFALAQIFSDGFIDDLELQVYNEADTARLLKFMLHG